MYTAGACCQMYNTWVNIRFVAIRFYYCCFSVYFEVGARLWMVRLETLRMDRVGVGSALVVGVVDIKCGCAVSRLVLVYIL